MKRVTVLLAGWILGYAMSTRAGLAQGTETPPLSSEQVASEPAPNRVTVAASDAVITVHGLCDSGDQSDKDDHNCVTVITRGAFDKLINSMNVTNKALTQETLRNLAETYAEYLALERPAVQAKLDDTPQFVEVMRWWRLRTLADIYRGRLQTQFAHPSAQEVHAYYMERRSSYDRVRLERVVIPRGQRNTDEDKSENDKALQMAQGARERVAKGEEPEVVQKDIYGQLKYAAAPVTNLGSLGRSSFPVDEVDEIFSLEPGQVSKVEKEAAYVIYKVKAKETLSEESQNEVISQEIAQQKVSDAIHAISQSAKPEFNDAYLGPHGAPAPPSHARTMRNSHP